MAAVNSHSGTLVAGAVSAFTINGWRWGLWVQNRDTASDIWVRLDQVDPVAEADGSFLVPAGAARNLPTVNGVIEVRLISIGTPKYSVSGAVPALVATP